MTALRLWFRSVLLEWLGYGFEKRTECVNWPRAIGTEACLLCDLGECVDTSLATGVESQVGLRRVPEVPRGVVRIVVEVCE